MNKQIVLLVGPCGSGKSTLAKVYKEQGFEYINQDSQGRQHLDLFDQAVKASKNVIVDRMNFTKGQRSRYLDLAKANGYTSKIVVLHQSYEVCYERCVNRKDHETIKEENAARSALNMFFSKYERVEDGEADVVNRMWPEGDKPKVVWSDLDGTLCDVSHRRHFVRCEDGQRKDWKGFFDAMVDDTVNESVAQTLAKFATSHKIVLCSGRPDNYKRQTEAWLNKHGIYYNDLFMRSRSDQRQDNVVKEILLDFEVLTRYSIEFCLDDRNQVVKMLRQRGLTVFQVAEGDF